MPRGLINNQTMHFTSILDGYASATSFVCGFVTSHPGDRLNKKDGLTRYGDSHVKDKTS